MMRIVNGYERPKRLTSRESECLSWTAAGKTSDEVAMILNLSVCTVNKHISNSMRKLNACNKIHAIIKALVERELKFSDIRF